MPKSPPDRRKIAFLLTIIFLGFACTLPGTDPEPINQNGGGNALPEAAGMVSAQTGGQVSSPDGMLTLDIPAGALLEDTDIQIGGPDSSQVAELFADPDPDAVAYQLEPSGLEFTQPISITLNLGTFSLDAASEDGLSAYYLLTQDEDGAVAALDHLNTEYLTEDGTRRVTGSLEHFSWVYGGKGSLGVTLEQVARKQVVGTQFKAQVSIGNTSKNNATELTVNSGKFFAFGKISLVSASKYVNAPTIVTTKQNLKNSGTFQCGAAVGIGSYSTQVKAVEKVPIKNNDPAVTKLRVTVDAVVECVAPTPTPTPSPQASETPPASATPTETLQPTSTPMPFIGMFLDIGPTIDGKTTYTIGTNEFFQGDDLAAFEFEWTLVLPPGDDCALNSAPLVTLPDQAWVGIWDHPDCDHAPNEQVQVLVSYNDQTQLILGPALGPASVNP